MEHTEDRLFQRWLTERLPAIGDADHRLLLGLFAAWHIQRRLRTLAGRGPLTSDQIRQACDQIRLATSFLNHLAQRGRGLTDCAQTDVDTWYAGGYTARRLTHAFLRWAMRSQHAPALVVPHRSTSKPRPDRPAPAPHAAATGREPWGPGTHTGAWRCHVVEGVSA
ncbi:MULTISPECIES: hypothetical protein [unclassified Streptomyces]|uniref:hypothetical protein n=1 Tax=unclassified Streptomyces TaxID=2593676 RepID=UPI0022514534|nr:MULTISPECIES: hypothetical protein [unclassified Streptomyces]MCX4869708.1 hypothetical protein [Streptomyces sp. NBC_00906]MCX4902663.1 hypothetical protein [Streptomyces sp. NBC_00892]